MPKISYHDALAALTKLCDAQAGSGMDPHFTIGYLRSMVAGLVADLPTKRGAAYVNDVNDTTNYYNTQVKNGKFY